MTTQRRLTFIQIAWARWIKDGKSLAECLRLCLGGVIFVLEIYTRLRIYKGYMRF
jgi:hypothetical protein